MKPKIGLALGGGAARGWAHIGIIRALIKAGIKPDVVAGTSIGALVGGAYVSGYLNELEEWVKSLTLKDVVSMLDIRLSGGLIHGHKVLKRLGEGMDGVLIEKLAIPFGAVATDLDDGKEIWIRRGEILGAVRASIALPGLFSPCKLNERWMVDGGLVNPVPVSLCRALGADFVIAVDLNSQVLRQNPMYRREHGEDAETQHDGVQNIAEELIATTNGSPRDRLGLLLQGLLDKFRSEGDEKEPTPSMLDVAVRSITIMSSRISRSRLAGDPAEVLLLPKLGHIGLMEFHRAKEAIAEGQAEIEKNQAQILDIKQKIK